MAARGVAVPVTPLGEAMAYVGVAILFAGPFRSWMERTDPSDLPKLLSEMIGNVFRRGTSGYGGGAYGAYRQPGAPVAAAPAPDLKTDADQVEDEGDEPA